MLPLSENLIFVFSIPKFSVFGILPTEISAFETWIISILPSSYLSSYSTLPSFISILTKEEFLCIVTPFDSKFSVTICAISSSSNGRILGALSIRYTLVLPMFENIVANSQPITPAPKITRLSGKSFQLLIPSLVTTIFSSIGKCANFLG